MWPDVLDGQPTRPRPGEEVTLQDPMGAFLGRAIADVPGSGPALRVLTRDPDDPPLRSLIPRRIAAARRLRDRVVPHGTTGFRLVHGEGDGLPGLVVDRYGPALVIRPDSDAWEPHLQAIRDALLSECSGVVAIVHAPKRRPSANLYGTVVPVEIIEEDRRYLVRPGFGQKTGFFLDQRPNRTHVEGLARPGDRALNLFCFTGGFSVALARGGASHVVSVDVADSVLVDCRDQFPRNGLDPAGHAFVTADVFTWLPSQHRADPFDLIVCDPPALGHKQADLETGREASRGLHRALGPLLARPGILVTASCTSRLSDEDLLQDAIAGLKQAGRNISRVLRRGGAGEDHPVPPTFPEGRYLHCLTLRVD